MPLQLAKCLLLNNLTIHIHRYATSQLTEKTVETIFLNYLLISGNFICFISVIFARLYIVLLINFLLYFFEGHYYQLSYCQMLLSSIIIIKKKN